MSKFSWLLAATGAALVVLVPVADVNYMALRLARPGQAPSWPPG
jgi:hypothetical protein